MYIEQKQDRIFKPTSVFTRSAEEDNQITTELQNLITAGGLTPDASDLTQVKKAVENIGASAAGMANVDLSNLSATGEGKFDAKANTALDNVTATGKNTAVSFAKPDFSSGVIIPSSTTFTANGFVTLYSLDIYNSAAAEAFINGYEVYLLFVAGSTSPVANINLIPVFAGDTITFSNMRSVVFFPLAINA